MLIFVKAHQSLVVIKISDRETLESRTARPTSCSFAKYAASTRPLYCALWREAYHSLRPCRSVGIRSAHPYHQQVLCVAREVCYFDGGLAHAVNARRASGGAHPAPASVRGVRELVVDIMMRFQTHPIPTEGIFAPVLSVKYGMSDMINVDAVRVPRMSSYASASAGCVRA
jgi:hypothetical protein